MTEREITPRMIEAGKAAWDKWRDEWEPNADASGVIAVYRAMRAAEPASEPDRPPRDSASGYPEGYRKQGSTGQLFKAKDHQWVRVTEPTAEPESAAPTFRGVPIHLEKIPDFQRPACEPQLSPELIISLSTLRDRLINYELEKDGDLEITNIRVSLAEIIGGLAFPAKPPASELKSDNDCATDMLLECADFFAATLAKADERAWRTLMIYAPKPDFSAEAREIAAKVREWVQTGDMGGYAHAPTEAAALVQEIIDARDGYADSHRLCHQDWEHQKARAEAAEAKLAKAREALSPPEVWLKEETDGVAEAYRVASTKHGHYESLFAACAWLLRHRAALAEIGE